MNNNINNMIIKCLEHYDSKQNVYELIRKENPIYYINSESNIFQLSWSKLEKDIKSYKFEILGFFDLGTKIWTWSWALPDLKLEDTILSKELLNYFLKLEPTSNTEFHYYLKSQFLNSKLLINNDIELDIYMSIISYLLKDKISFIVDRKEKSDQMIYYLIK
jgi:hypothetical protein